MVGTSRRQQPNDIEATLELVRDAKKYQAEIERLADATRKLNDAREKHRAAKAEAEQAAETAKAATATQAEIDALRDDLRAQIERAKIRETKAATVLAQGRDRMARTETIWLGSPNQGGIETGWSIRSK